MSSIPSGTVTFLFTDIEGSTRLAQQYPDDLPRLMARHHEILTQSIQAHDGYVYELSGDSVCAAFSEGRSPPPARCTRAGPLSVLRAADFAAAGLAGGALGFLGIFGPEVQRSKAAKLGHRPRRTCRSGCRSPPGPQRPGCAGDGPVLRWRG